MESWESEAGESIRFWSAGRQKLVAVIGFGELESEGGGSSRFWRAGGQTLVTVLGFGELGVRSW